MAVRSSRSVALVATQRPRSGHGSAIGAVSALALGAASTSFVFPIGVALLIGLLAVAGFFGARASAPRARAAWTSRTSRRARAARYRARERALAATTLGGRETLIELTRLIDEMGITPRDLAAPFELEDLLDRHVALALAHEQASRAAMMFDRAQLERAHDAYRADPAADKRRLDLYERRLHAHDECQARVAALANELALVADLVRLLAQRAACPDEPTQDDRIERRLAEIDELDDVRKQLADDLG